MATLNHFILRRPRLYFEAVVGIPVFDPFPNIPQYKPGGAILPELPDMRHFMPYPSRVCPESTFRDTIQMNGIAEYHSDAGFLTESRGYASEGRIFFDDRLLCMLHACKSKVASGISSSITTRNKTPLS